MFAWDWAVAGPVLGGALCGAGIACAAYTAQLFTRTRSSTFLRLRVARLHERQTWVRLSTALGAGTAIGVITGWPIGILLAVAAGWWMPVLLGPDTTAQREADRTEALASWAEQLRDVISAASGLHQAVTATADLAPGPIRAQVQALDARLRAGQTMEAATVEFARECDSDLADLIALTLTMGTSRQGADVGGTLSRLAETARDRAATVTRVSASRARTRSSVRIIAAATVLMLVGMALVVPEFLAPLSTATGQLVLGVVGGIWAMSFYWLSRLTCPPDQTRPFAPASGAATGVGGRV